MADVVGSATITITFDDALLCQFEAGYPVLRNHGVSGVVFVPTALLGQWFEGQRVMDLNQLRELTNAGWEIGSHTVSHPNLVSGARTKLALPALEAELRESRDWLVANGFLVISFAYPYGACNAEVAAVARRYYRYARTCDRGLNEISSADTQLKRFNLCHRNWKEWNLSVDSARDQNKWLIAMVHAVVDSEDQIPSCKEGLYICKKELAKCLEHANHAGVPIRTIREVYERYRHLPERSVAVDVTPACRAGVDVKIELVGATANITVTDERKRFKLRFQLPSSEEHAIVSEIGRRVAFDLELSVGEIETLVRRATRERNQCAM